MVDRSDGASFGPVGAWVMRAVSYVSPDRRHCAACGRPLSRRAWEVPGDDGSLVFCGPTHEMLYHDYCLPLHGSGAINVGER